MDSNHNESNNTSSITNLLRREIEHTMERSFKLEERKIIFVIGLFGLGGFNISIFFPGHSGISSLPHLFFLAPFLAILFDILIIKQKFSIRRIGAFLEKNSNDNLEKKWEEFVSDNREEESFNYSHIGFTCITIAASFIAIISNKDYGFPYIEYITIFWLIVIGTLYSSVLYRYINLIKQLKIKKSKNLDITS